MLVTGAGNLRTINGLLNIGSDINSYNQLIIANGGAVCSTGRVVAGGNTGSLGSAAATWRQITGRRCLRSEGPHSDSWIL